MWTDVVDRRIPWVDSIPTRRTPTICVISIDKRVASLEIDWEFEEGIVLAFDILPCDFLLNHRLTPVLIEPGLFDLFLGGMREEERVFETTNIKVHLA